MDAGQGGVGVVVDGEQRVEKVAVEPRDEEGVVGPQVLDEVRSHGIVAEREDDVGVAEADHVDLSGAPGVPREGDGTGGLEGLGQRCVGEEVLGGSIDVDRVGDTGQAERGLTADRVGEAGDEVDELDAGWQEDDRDAVGLEGGALEGEAEDGLADGARPAAGGDADVEDGGAGGLLVVGCAQAHQDPVGGVAPLGGTAIEACGPAGDVVTVGVERRLAEDGGGDRHGAGAMEAEGDEVEEGGLDGADEDEVVGRGSGEVFHVASA